MSRRDQRRREWSVAVGAPFLAMTLLAPCAWLCNPVSQRNIEYASEGGLSIYIFFFVPPLLLSGGFLSLRFFERFAGRKLADWEAKIYFVVTGAACIPLCLVVRFITFFLHPFNLSEPTQLVLDTGLAVLATSLLGLLTVVAMRPR